MPPMKRGEVWWIDFHGSIGGEIQNERPAIIVSNDTANRHLNRVQVVPLTTNVSRLYASEAFVMVRGRKQKALADQLQTIDKGRLVNRVGTLTPTDMKAVERVIKLHLALP